MKAYYSRDGNSKVNEGSRAYSKGGRVRKRITLNGRGLESTLERGKGSKAHSKGGRVRKRTNLNGRRLEGALERGGKILIFFRWPNSHGRPARVEKFSKVKNFQKQFQS